MADPWRPRRATPPPHAKRNGASREDLLRRRVLPLEAFANELARCGGSAQAMKLPVAERVRRFGSTVMPIPVPLAPGECEELFERRFQEWMKQRGIVLDVVDASRERTTRCSYATFLAKAFLRTGTVPTLVVDKDEEVEEGEEVEDVVTKQEAANPERVDLRLVPREVLNATTVCTLREYQDDVRTGKFAKLTLMSASEKQRLYGFPVVPIAVPLAPGETGEQYEQRFLDWLKRVNNMTLNDLRAHRVPMLERYKRLDFASLNGKGIERFVPPCTPPLKREVEPATISLTPAKKAKVAQPEVKTKPPKEEHKSQACKGRSSVAKCVACQCHKCLVNGIKILADGVSALETRRRSGLVTHDEKAVDDAPDGRDDCEVARQLQQAYDEINDNIVLNENALEIEETRLACGEDVTDLNERIQLQQENEELRQMIQEEYPARRATVATLIAYRWRRNLSALRQMLAQPEVSDLPHVQHKVHRRCFDIAKKIAERVASEAEQSRETDEVMRRLERARWQELDLLVHFDADVRRGIFAMLTHPDVPPSLADHSK